MRIARRIYILVTPGSLRVNVTLVSFTAVFFFLGGGGGVTQRRGASLRDMPKTAAKEINVTLVCGQNKGINFYN